MTDNDGMSIGSGKSNVPSVYVLKKSRRNFSSFSCPILASVRSDDEFCGRRNDCLKIATKGANSGCGAESVSLLLFFFQQRLLR